MGAATAVATGRVTTPPSLGGTAVGDGAGPRGAVVEQPAMTKAASRRANRAVARGAVGFELGFIGRSSCLALFAIPMPPNASVISSGCSAPNGPGKGNPEADGRRLQWPRNKIVPPDPGAFSWSRSDECGRARPWRARATFHTSGPSSATGLSARRSPVSPGAGREMAAAEPIVGLLPAGG